MLHQLLFFALYFAILPGVLLSPFTGVLVYKWLEDLPPEHTYQFTFIPGYLSFAIGALTFVAWIFREKKDIPRPPGLAILLLLLLIWINITYIFAVVPEAGALKWDRTIKVIGFAILTAQMVSTRSRLEAFVWVLVLSVSY